MPLSPIRTHARAAVPLRRLTRLAPIGQDAEALILGLEELQNYRPGSELAGERDPVQKPRFLVSGWAARVRWLPDGRRQIFNMIVPGEALGVCERPNPLALATVIALTSVQTLDATPVQRAINSDDPRWNGLRDAVHVSASYDEAYMLAQIMRLGRQTAYERICHLLLELRDRLAMVGLGEDNRFPMPLTQEMLADATGLSIVHVNRILQQLRRDRLLDIASGQVRFLDRPALEAVADYRRPEPVGRS